MSIAKSCMKQATGEANDNGIESYKPPRKRKAPATKKKSSARSILGTQAARSVSDAEAQTMRPQRNAKGQYISGHNGQFKEGNQAALKWSEEKAVALGQELLDWMNEDPRNFLMKDFLFEHDLYADIISYLSGRYPSFSEYITRAKEIEAHRIQKFALTNNINANMAQWVLGVHHKQHNVQRQEITGKDGAPLTAPTITIQPVRAQAETETDKDNAGTPAESENV